MIIIIAHHINKKLLYNIPFVDDHPLVELTCTVAIHEVFRSAHCPAVVCVDNMSALLSLLYVLALHLLTCADVHGIKNSERGDSHGIEKVVKSAKIIPGKYIFYGNTENFKKYKKEYYSIIVQIRFSKSMNLTHVKTSKFDADEEAPGGYTRTISTSLDKANRTQLYGMTRLSCMDRGNTRIFESHPIRKYGHSPMLMLMKDKFPRFLIPVTSNDISIRDISHILQKTAKNEYTALLISKFKTLLPSTQSKCHLTFLHPDDQQMQEEYGAGQIVDTSTGKGVFGRLPLTISSQIYESQPKKRVTKVNSKVVDTYIGLTGKQALMHHGDELHSRMKTLDKQCLKLPGIPGKINFDDERIAEEVSRKKPTKKGSVTARRRGLLATLHNPEAAPGEEEVNENRKFDLFIPILQQIIPFLLQLVGIQGSDVGQTAKNQVLQEGVQTASADLAHQIYTQLFQAMRAHMLETSLPPLTETIGENVAESTIELVKAHLVNSIPDKIKMPIAEIITKNVQYSVPTMVDDHTPKYTAMMLAKSLNHRLPRSLAHSIVPSLMHTLTHNPLQDFYCYYCHAHKTYCQYCNYGPQQVYYAMYYAGFYSTYYTDYYVDWMYRKMSAENLVGGNAEGNSGEIPPLRRL